MVVGQYLGLGDVVLRLGGVCHSWREAARLFPSRCPSSYSTLISTIHTGSPSSLEDFLLILHSSDEVFRPHKAVLRLLSGGKSVAEAKHFAKTARFHLETDHIAQTGTVAYRSFKLRHASPYGDLLIPASSLAQICRQSRETMVDLCLQNCLYWSEELATAVGECERVERLNLSYSNAGDEVVEMVGKKIRTLVFRRGMRLTARAVEAIGRMEFLRELDLSYCFDGETPSLQPLTSLPLTHLLLDGLTLTPTCLHPLTSLPSLLVLSLKDTVGLTDSHLFAIFPHLASLQQLNVEVSSPVTITESGLFEAVSDYLPVLRRLRAPSELVSPRITALIPSSL